MRGCVCSQRPETALAYALPVWSAMADKVRSGGGQGETGRGLTVGVDGDRVAIVTPQVFAFHICTCISWT